MPQAIPIVANIVANSILAITGSATFAAAAGNAILWLGSGTFLSNLVLTSGLGMISNALAGKPGASGAADRGTQLQFGKQPNASRLFVYGETGVAGHIIKTAATGENNKYMHIICALGDGGEYESIEEVRLSTEPVTLDGSGNVTSPAKWANKARIETALGSESQAAFSNAVSEIAGWTSNHRGRGVCMSYLRFEYDPEVWTSGIPEPLFVVRGRKVYDPRLDTSPGADPTNASYWAWTQNPALWLLDYIRGIEVNSVRLAGLGIPDGLIDYDTFADAADVCDETVSVLAGGTIPRYTGGGGVVGSDDDPLTVMRTFLAAFGGVVTTRSGKLACFAAEAQTATVTLDDDDLAGPIKITASTSIRDTANAITSQYRDTGTYQMTSAPAYRNSTWETEDDSEVLWSDLRLPFTDDYRRAQRLAKIFGGDKREPRQLEARFKIKAMQVQEGDVFTLDSDSFGSAANGKYRLIQRTINPDSTVDVIARSETDAKYSWDHTTEEGAAPEATTTTPSTPTPDTPSGWTAGVTEVEGPQGTPRSVIDVTPPTLPASVQFVELEYQRQEGSTLGLDFKGDQYGNESSGATADSGYIPIATLTRAQAENGYRLENVERARGYSIRVRYRNAFNIASSYQTVPVEVESAGSVITAPTGWTATSSTQTSPEGYTQPFIRVTAPSAGIPAAAAVVAIDFRKPTESEYSDQLILSRAEAARGRYIRAVADQDYFVRVRYGTDLSTWGPEQILAVSTSATGSLSLSSFALAAADASSGAYTVPGFKATWDALTGDDLARANNIEIQFRKNGETNAYTVYAEKDETEKTVLNLLPSTQYNVRARVSEVYAAGAWTSWTNVTTNASWVVAEASSVEWENVADGSATRPDDNATVGATWGSNIGSQPDWSTDNRVPNGLDSSGDVARNVPNAYIQEAGVTQHEAALSIAGPQVTSGTLPDARIQSSGVTQHEGDIDALNLDNAPAEAGATAGATWDTGSGGNVTGQPVDLAAFDEAANRRGYVGSLPFYTLRLNFEDGAYTSNTSGALAFKATVAANDIDAGAVVEAKLGTGAVTQTKIGNGAVDDAQVANNRALIVEGSGPPTATSTRLYHDTTNDVAYLDDGTTVIRLSKQIKTDSLNSDATYDGGYKVVCGVEIANVQDIDELAAHVVSVTMQGPNAANGTGALADWDLFISDTSIAEGSAITGATNYAAFGNAASRMTFHTVGPFTEVDDDTTAQLATSSRFVGATYEGTCYVYLCVEVTGSGPPEVYVDADTSITVLIR